MKFYSIAITALLAPLALARLENLERPEPKELVYSKDASLPNDEADLTMFEDSFYDRDKEEGDIIPARGRALAKKKVSYYSK